MKYIIGLTTLLTLGHVFSIAQFNHGLQAGMNISYIKSQTTNAPEAATGGHFGWYGQIQFKNDLTLVTGISFSDKGFIKEHVRRHFIYAMMPVMARYPLWKKLSIEAGGGIGFLAYDDAKYDPKWGRVPNELGRDIWKNRFDAQLSDGIQYQVSQRLGLVLRYEHGLSNLVGDAAVHFQQSGSDPMYDQDPITYRDLGIKDLNRNFQLSLSYSLTHK